MFMKYCAPLMYHDLTDMGLLGWWRIQKSYCKDLEGTSHIRRCDKRLLFAKVSFSITLCSTMTHDRIEYKEAYCDSSFRKWKFLSEMSHFLKKGNSVLLESNEDWDAIRHFEERFLNLNYITSHFPSNLRFWHLLGNWQFCRFVNCSLIGTNKYLLNAVGSRDIAIKKIKSPCCHWIIF